MHGAGHVLEVADALVDGEWPVLVPASSSGRSGGQQGAKRRNRWSKCARLTDSVPDDCSESERRYFFNSAGPQRHPRVARAPPPSRADASGGGGARPLRLREHQFRLPDTACGRHGGGGGGFEAGTGAGSFPAGRASQSDLAGEFLSGRAIRPEVGPAGYIRGRRPDFTQRETPNY